MPRISFVLNDGRRRGVDVPAGYSVMRAAITQNVPGIDAECGGACACGTCHVYLAPADVVRVPPPSAAEREMLEAVAAELRPESRLSCQILLTETLHGLVVHLPDRQY